MLLLEHMLQKCEKKSRGRPVLLSRTTNEHQLSFITFHYRADVKIPAPPDEPVLCYAAGAGTLFTADPVCFDGVKSPRGTERILWAVVLHK